MSKAAIQQNDWQEVKLGDIAEVQNGYSFKSGDYVGFTSNELEVLKMGHIERGGGLRENPKKDYVPRNEKLKRWMLNKNDIVLAMTDMKDNVVILGVPALIDKDDHYVLNQRVARLKLNSNKEVDIHFLYNYLKWDDFLNTLRSKANSGVQVNLTTEAIKNSPILLPPLTEQKAIAEVLSSLDDKIDLLHRQNKTLEDIAQALFRKWFVEEVKEDWEEKPLDKIASYLNGLACQKYSPKNEVEKLPVLKIKELGNGITENSDWATPEVDSKYIVNLGDVIFSWSGSLMLKIWDGQKCVLNQHLFKVTSEKYPKWFYYFWTKHYLEKFIGIANSKATTMGHIKRSDLSNSLVLIPKENEIAKMDEKMTPMFKKLILNMKQIRTLENLRGNLLPKLMSGEVRVKF